MFDHWALYVSCGVAGLHHVLQRRIVSPLQSLGSLLVIGALLTIAHKILRFEDIEPGHGHRSADLP